jgi:hypothetical protein
VGSDDDSIEVVRVGAVEAELVSAQLRSAGIQAAVVAVGTAGEQAPIQFSEGSRVMVRRADVRAAREALAELPGVGGPPGELDAAVLAAEAEAAAGWSDPETGAVV